MWWFLSIACSGPGDDAKPGDTGRAGAFAAPLAVADGVYVDGWGRQVLLRGVNARVEGLFDVTFDDGRVALEEIPPFTAEDCRFLSEELGHDLLRLPINWSAIEPEQDVYDDAYLDQVMDLVDGCWDVGVWTLVDLHQDAYSKHIGEDGAPLWAIVPEPTELLEGPLDDLADRRTSAQVLAAFASLYRDEAGLTQAYARMSAHVAGRIAGHPGVVGLELQNEPVTLGQQELLDAFHGVVGAAVEDAAPGLPVVFEPDSLRNFTDDAPVLTPAPFAQPVYAPHIYTDVFEDGWASRDEAAIRDSVDRAAVEAADHGAALLVGEFGHDFREEVGLHYLETVFDAMDDVQASWAYWVYEEWSQDSWGLYDGTEAGGRTGLREAGAVLLARPYPIAVDGRLTALSWSPSGGLRVGLADAGGGPHLLAAPARAFPDGIVAACDGTPVDVEVVGPARIEVACAGASLTLTGP